MEDFMDSLTQEQDKLVKMGIIKYTKDQALAAVVLNQGNGKKNSKDSKQKENKENEKPKYFDGGSILARTKERRRQNAIIVSKFGIQRMHA